MQSGFLLITGKQLLAKNNYRQIVFALIGTSLKFRASIDILARDPLNGFLLSVLGVVKESSQLNCVFINSIPT